MGKAQKKKAMRRHNPMRVPDSHLPKGLASASESSSKSNEILPIIQKMETGDGGERKWACVAVSNLIQNDPSTRRLLQGKNIVGALITRLTDSEEEVVVEAAGALRNLCIDGGYNICAEMYNKNILTPLKDSIPKISATLSQFLTESKASPDNVKKIVYELADNILTIIWCLSETSNKALNAINELHLVPFLMSFLSARQKLSLSPVTSAAQCLYVLTDDNYPAISELRADAGYIAILLAIARAEHETEDKNQQPPNFKMLQVLAAGILKNISPIPPPSSASFIDMDNEVVLPLLQPVISSINLVDVTTSVQELALRQASEPQIENLSLKGTPSLDHKSSVEIELEQLESKLRTVQLALEILTGVSAKLPDPEPENPEDEVEEDDQDVDIDDDNAEETVDIDVDMAADPAVDNSTQESTPNFLNNLVSPLLALIQPTSLSFPPLAAPSAHPPTTSALSAVHVCALECLNNIFLSLAITPNKTITSDVEAGLKVWNTTWTALSLVGTQTGLGQERRQEFWEIAVGILWGVGRVWKGSVPPDGEQVSLLIRLCNSTSDTNLRVKCIGTLECLAQNPNSVDGNQAIANYLLSLLPKTTTPSSVGTEPMIQAVSAIIDIFSDENMPYDVNFRQGEYLVQLTAAAEGVRKAVKAIDRRKEGDLKRHAENVRDNLVAFIKYRRSLRL